ncbi:MULTISPECIES: hypothetical protein [Rhodococcus]|uniref:Uncharacterized protein n=1 Tax=Rhodococcus oxybenzonivorans TaxID=1990687 RepID=A0AAE5A8D5_9NOCA|nr:MULTISPECIES: hypothetical protein [Rhodococcus]MDV7242235.1 hypothetical protein [Rhodococcus oxybenzonivorans]MDV7266619.1 hypothetical protein [Rhodococcus oxybenzonivorans]MDV7276270.1 hypothetical protein [Rhodococcus oxybenzonivorans]MDV7331723.1 hypothetical protein [Rhodococcus oxybenzonivorans]MDV7343945.1 hypothetical protein [Rhodococcus oxybenzonivorans]
MRDLVEPVVVGNRFTVFLLAGVGHEDLVSRFPERLRVHPQDGPVFGVVPGPAPLWAGGGDPPDFDIALAPSGFARTSGAAC